MDAIIYSQLLDQGCLERIVAGTIRDAMKAHGGGEAIHRSFTGSIAKRAASELRARFMALDKDHPELLKALEAKKVEIWKGEREAMEARVTSLQKQRDDLLAKLHEHGMLVK